MSIQTDSNEPKVEPTTAAAAEVPAKVEVESPSATETEIPVETASTESEVVETEESSETEPEVKVEPGKKKGGFQRRIDKLNAQKTAAQQEAEFWKQQALKGAGATETKPKVETTEVQAIDGKPDPAKFETHAAFVEALTDWKTDQKLKDHDQKAEKAKMVTEQGKVVSAYAEKVKTFSEKTSDFQDVLSEVDDIQLSPAVREILLTADNGPELAYELAKNREEYARVCKLPSLAAAREMGKLEARLAKTSSPDGKTELKTTKAPQPLAPVRGGGTASVPKTLEEAAASSFQEYKKIREAELKKQRKQA